MPAQVATKASQVVKAGDTVACELLPPAPMEVRAPRVTLDGWKVSATAAAETMAACYTLPASWQPLGTTDAPAPRRTRPLQAVPQPIPLDIAYEDAHVIVVNKVGRRPMGATAAPAAALFALPPQRRRGRAATGRPWPRQAMLTAACSLLPLPCRAAGGHGGAHIARPHQRHAGQRAAVPLWAGPAGGAQRLAGACGADGPAGAGGAGR